MTSARAHPWNPTRFARRYLLGLLMAAYVAATYVPQWGLRLRATFTDTTAASPIHLMLALLLFTLGLSTPWSRFLELARQFKWVAASILIRAVACVIMALLIRTMPAEWAITSAGLILVLAMPTAVSSSGWCVQLASSQTVCLALIIGTTIASAATAPLLLGASGVIAGGDAAEKLIVLRSLYSLKFVLPWVLLPTLLGITVGSLPVKFVKPIRRWGHAFNPFALLLLNYANAASSLPQFRETGLSMRFSLFIGGCALLFTAVSAMAEITARRLSSNRPKRISTVLGTGMSNTGLALVIATLALPTDFGLHVAVIVYTFVQHLGAALLAKWEWPNEERILGAP